MNGIICCQEPTSEIIRVEKQFSRLRFKCRTTFFLGFKIDADVAPHYIIYMRLCTIHATLKSTMRSPAFLVVSSPRSSSAVESACFVPDDCVLFLYASYSASAVMHASELFDHPSHLHQQYPLLNHLRHFTLSISIDTIDWVSSAMIWVGSAL